MNLRFIIRKNKKGWEDHFATHYANFALINAFKCGNKVTAICIFVFELICKSKASISSTLYYERISIVSVYLISSLRLRNIASKTRISHDYFINILVYQCAIRKKLFFCKMTDWLAVNMSCRMTSLFWPISLIKILI